MKRILNKMENSIIPQNDGFLVSGSDKNIFFPNAELLNVGCKNCIWKLHSQCPYGLVDEEIYPRDVLSKIKASVENPFSDENNCEVWKNEVLSENPHNSSINGICPDMVNFLSSLAEKNSTLTEVWEKFHIYKARLQESVDYADFIKLNREIAEKEKDLKKGLFSEMDYELLDRLKMDRNAAKIWWARLNQHVVQSMQKVNDRESKNVLSPKLPGIMSSGTINFNISKEIKQKEITGG